MVRFLVLIMAVAAVYFGWHWYVDKGSSRAADRADLAGLTEAAAPKPADAGPPSLQAPTEAPGQAASATPAGTAQPAVAALARRIEAQDAEALRVGFTRAVYARQDADRAPILAALQDAADRAETLEQRLAVLGDGNAFLHAPAGRELVATVLDDLRRLDKKRALAVTNQLLERCMRGEITKDHKAARRLVDQIYQKHRGLVDAVVCNPANLEKARSHKVRPGESPDGIAGRFRRQGIQIEGWTLCILNRIGTPNRLQAGKTIKIPTEKIWAKVEKESFLMAVYVGETIVRLYWVGHGREGKDTPETTFTIGAKLANPDWYAPDGNVYAFGRPENVLGRYFVKFEHGSLTGFGAHGTAEPETVGTRSSLGCIRMRDQDIEEFFRFMPRNTEVVIAATR